MHIAAVVRHFQVTAWGWYWLAVGIALAAPEIYWAIVKSANTISDNAWAVERLNSAHPLDFAQWTPAHWAIAFGLWILFGWLSVHIPFGWLSP